MKNCQEHQDWMKDGDVFFNQPKITADAQQLERRACSASVASHDSSRLMREEYSYSAFHASRNYLNIVPISIFAGNIILRHNFLDERITRFASPRIWIY